MDVANLEMRNNNFQTFSQPSSLSIRYSDSFTLANNFYRSLLLPDVHCKAKDHPSARHGPTAVKMNVSFSDAQAWWESLDVTSIGAQQPSSRGAVGNGMETGNKCPDMDALNKFFTGLPEDPTSTVKPLVGSPPPFGSGGQTPFSSIHTFGFLSSITLIVVLMVC